MPITKHTLLILAIILTGTAFTACRKKSNTIVNPDAVTITVQNPKSGQVYHKGDTLNIVATVTYTTELHGYFLQLLDTVSNKAFFEQSEDIHDDHFTIQQQWVDTCTQIKSLQLIINANLDHAGTQAADTIWIKTTP